jgi:predicted SAM-dependent methyltransferase
MNNADEKKFLNLGCGHRYRKEWTNIDFRSTGKEVMAYNLLKGIPFKDDTFDIVYHSNVIEHFSKEEAPKFLKECYRVLKSNGIIRIAFPDLEQIVFHYMRLLNELKKGNLQYEADYDWIMLELYDQTVRNISGGEMFKYFVRESIPNEKFVLERCGTEVKNLIRYGKEMFNESTPPPPGNTVLIQKHSIIDILKIVKRKILKLTKNSSEKIFCKNYVAFNIGKFRLGGEIHQWMYDAYSLGRLLKIIGFKNIVTRDAFTSYYENWESFNLDTEEDGSIYKPDSNYVEAIK